MARPLVRNRARSASAGAASTESPLSPCAPADAVRPERGNPARQVCKHTSVRMSPVAVSPEKASSGVRLLRAAPVRTKRARGCPGCCSPSGTHAAGRRRPRRHCSKTSLNDCEYSSDLASDSSLSDHKLIIIIIHIAPTPLCAVPICPRTSTHECTTGMYLHGVRYLL